MLRRSLVIVLGMIAVLLPTAITTSVAGAQETATYEITFENLTSGQYLTPPNYAVHSNSADVFDLRSPASPGVQAVAENGAVPVLAAELNGAVDAAGLGVSGVGGDAPLAPGDSTTFTVVSDERKFSLVSMIICTNDGFTGADSKRLPTSDGQTITYDLRGYDAGTEVNTENRADIVPAPFCGDGGGTGESNPSLAENGVIKVHRNILGNGDLPAKFAWDNNEGVARVSITRMSDTDLPAPSPVEAPNYTVTFTNNTSGQYFTPPNYAIHSNSVEVFDLRSPASPGVQAVAENGGVPVLAAELNGAVDAAGLGVSGVGADAPIAPGQSVSFDVSSDELKFSLVSMIICTNDGFTGADSKSLPSSVGQTISYDLRGYDAGTEVNTENRADIVPAPFCGDGGGTGESNPSLAENGVIKVHRNILGNGDLPANFAWDNNEAIVTVTITRNS